MGTALHSTLPQPPCHLPNVPEWALRLVIPLVPRPSTLPSIEAQTAPRERPAPHSPMSPEGTHRAHLRAHCMVLSMSSSQHLQPVQLSQRAPRGHEGHLGKTLPDTHRRGPEGAVGVRSIRWRRPGADSGNSQWVESVMRPRSVRQGRAICSPACTPASRRPRGRYLRAQQGRAGRALVGAQRWAPCRTRRPWAGGTQEAQPAATAPPCLPLLVSNRL